MQGWKTTTNRKKIQRHINREIRTMNKCIEQDNLWFGRFYCRQYSIHFHPAEDGTYVYAVVIIDFFDRKTGKTMRSYFKKEDFMGSAWRLWEKMNNFIVEWCDVWSENPRPSISSPWDYRKELKNEKKTKL